MCASQESKTLAFRGRKIAAESVRLPSFEIAVTQGLFRMATVWDEAWQDECVTEPLSIVSALSRPRPRADIFAFSQRLPHVDRQFPFYCEYDNVAAIPITSFDDWIKQIKPSARNKVRKAERSGITTRAACFDDELVRGIWEMYNESPTRQGKRFWHYGKDVETVRQENGTYLDKSEWIGAYLQGELVGFLKMVYVGSYAEVMQILTFIRQRDKAPTNALLAKAVQICCEKRLSHFVYANFAYGKKGEDSLSEFKRENGFRRIDIPRYFIPLTLKGRVALKLGLHRPLVTFLPRGLLMRLLRIRKEWLDFRARRFASRRRGGGSAPT